jgi:serine/threonine protein kinase/tetratricopeptide (TPR) repeat protein
VSDALPRSERWARLGDIFDRASELPLADRAAFLEQACGGDAALRSEVESLLDYDHGDHPNLARGIHGALSEEASSIGEAVPRIERVGPYRLRREIGRGGMGAVYLAERDDDFTQQVAIKVVRGFLAPDAVRRFRAERQILATLQHPGIARLLDGGTTADGLPYLVMEYVDGVPIDDYCDAHDLSTRARLELFVRVCDAVTAAHRSLVVHRDLKPSNILVTPAGDPKLLDFGIAKLLEDDSAELVQLTTPSMRIMTPHFASPEQVRGEPITTSSDVYSLGVLLFTLLTGQRPYEITSRRPEDIERVVSRQEPPRPSAVAGGDSRRARDLRGDLDTIVLMALQKEPARRFASVDHLAQDLRRFLAGLPVLATPSTLGYRAKRFVQRHRAGVTTAAIFLITIIGFAVALAVSAAQARRERDAAERVTQMLIQMFSGSDPRTLRGDTITARELLDRGADRIRNDLRDQPAMQARLFDTLGAIYAGIGLPMRAQSVLQESMDVRDGGTVVDSQPAARTMMRLSGALLERGQLAAAEPLARGAYEMTKRLVGPVNPQVGESLITLAQIVNATGRGEEAERLFLEATQIFRETLGPEHPMVALGLQHTARIRFARGDLNGADRLAREALVLQRRVFGIATAESLIILARISRQEGRLEEAETLMRDALRARREGFGNLAHPSVEQTLMELAELLSERGNAAEAEALHAEAKAMTAKRLGPN